MAELARAAGFAPVDGILLDLGLSSDQLADRERGFSFAADAPLDMRFDPTRGPSAAELVNTLDEAELADVLYRYGEERRSRAIARRIVRARARARRSTRTGELARLVAGVVHGRPGGIHPATRTFQALRIAVNDELGSLEAALPAALDAAARRRAAGRHQLSFAGRSHRQAASSRLRSAAASARRSCRRASAGARRACASCTRHPIVAGEDELARNPRARSAKLRVAQRLETSSP